MHIFGPQFRIIKSESEVGRLSPGIVFSKPARQILHMLRFENHCLRAQGQCLVTVPIAKGPKKIKKEMGGCLCRYGRESKRRPH